MEKVLMLVCVAVLVVVFVGNAVATVNSTVEDVAEDVVAVENQGILVQIMTTLIDTLSGDDG